MQAWYAGQLKGMHYYPKYKDFGPPGLTFMQLLGSQFMAHPPIHEYEVHNTAPDHPLVKGIPSFKVDDELYLCKYHGEHQTLLHTHWSEPVENFVRDDWMKDTDVQPVLYIHTHGSVPA